MTSSPRSWPRSSADEIAIARYGLVPTPSDGWLDHAKWPVLRDACLELRLGGLLAAALDSGARTPSPDELADLGDRLAPRLGQVVLLERELLEIAASFDRLGIPFRVLKGLANARLDYPEPSQRLFGDLDLLIPAGSIDLARVALESSGHVIVGPHRRAPLDFRFEKGITFKSPAGLEIDVHRVLASGPFGECWDPGHLFETVEWFSVGGVVLPALAREERFVHACISATISDLTPRIRPSRDVAQLLLDPRLDHARAIRLASSSGLAALVAAAVTLSTGWLDLQVVSSLTRWADDFEPGPRDRARLVLSSRGKGGLPLRLGGSMMEMDGLVERLDFARYCIRNRPQRLPRPTAR